MKLEPFFKKQAIPASSAGLPRETWSSLRYGFRAIWRVHECPQKKQKPEEIVAKLRHVDGLVSQGHSVAEAVRSISVTQFTYFKCRKEFDGPKADQVKRLKELEKYRAIAASLV